MVVGQHGRWPREVLGGSGGVSPRPPQPASELQVLQGSRLREASGHTERRTQEVLAEDTGIGASGEPCFLVLLVLVSGAQSCYSKLTCSEFTYYLLLSLLFVVRPGT